MTTSAISDLARKVEVIAKDVSTISTRLSTLKKSTWQNGSTSLYYICMSIDADTDAITPLFNNLVSSFTASVVDKKVKEWNKNSTWSFIINKTRWHCQERMMTLTLSKACCTIILALILSSPMLCMCISKNLVIGLDF